MNRKRLFPSDYSNLSRLRASEGSLPRRELVEEYNAVAIHVVQAAFGKEKLLDALRRGLPFRLPVPCGSYDVSIVEELHQLPGPLYRQSSFEEGNARLWFVCLGCLRKKRKLYYRQNSELRCRECHGLTYKSSISGRNVWWKTIVKPLKLLLHERETLLARPLNKGSKSRIHKIDEMIEVLQKKAEPKNASNRKPRTTQRRKCRDLSFLLQDLPVKQSNRRSEIKLPSVQKPTQQREIKPVMPRGPLAPSDAENYMEEVASSQLKILKTLLPLAIATMREAENAPECAGNPKYARTRRELERKQLRLEQSVFRRA